MPKCECCGGEKHKIVNHHFYWYQNIRDKNKVIYESHGVCLSCNNILIAKRIIGEYELPVYIDSAFYSHVLPSWVAQKELVSKGAYCCCKFPIRATMRVLVKYKEADYLPFMRGLVQRWGADKV